MRENTARIRYDREHLASVLSVRLHLPSSTVAAALTRYEQERTVGKDAPCQSVVWHGPGHQSSTHCQATGGESGHDHIGPDGYYSPTAPAQHVADLPSGGTAEWTDDDPYVRD